MPTRLAGAFFFGEAMTQGPYLSPSLRLVGVNPHWMVVEQDMHGYYLRERTDEELDDVLDTNRRTQMRRAHFVAELSHLTGIPVVELATGRKIPRARKGKVASGQGRAYYDEIRDRVDILALAQELTEMKRSGKSWKGRCPFHADRTPSFVVWPESRGWRCFGACAEGGDVITLYQKAKDARLL